MSSSQPTSASEQLATMLQNLTSRGIPITPALLEELSKNIALSEGQEARGGSTAAAPSSSAATTADTRLTAERAQDGVAGKQADSGVTAATPSSPQTPGLQGVTVVASAKSKKAYMFEGEQYDKVLPR